MHHSMNQPAHPRYADRLLCLQGGFSHITTFHFKTTDPYPGQIYYDPDVLAVYLFCLHQIYIGCIQSQNIPTQARLSLFGYEPQDLHFMDGPLELPLQPGQEVAMRAWWRSSARQFEKLTEAPSSGPASDNINSSTGGRNMNSDGSSTVGTVTPSLAPPRDAATSSTSQSDPEKEAYAQAELTRMVGEWDVSLKVGGSDHQSWY